MLGWLAMALYKLVRSLLSMQSKSEACHGARYAYALPWLVQVSYYDYALDLILDADSPSTEILTDEQHELVESAAETLYGLIHVRSAQPADCDAWCNSELLVGCIPSIEHL